MICLRKREVTVTRIAFYNVIEKLMEPGIHYLPCFYISDVIDLFCSNYDINFKVTSSGCHSLKVQNTTVGYFL